MNDSAATEATFTPFAETTPAPLAETGTDATAASGTRPRRRSDPGADR